MVTAATIEFLPGRVMRLTLLLVLVVRGASAQPVTVADRPEDVARRFVELLLAAGEGDLDALMTETMRAALAPAQRGAMLAGLREQLGAVKGIGTAWHQDDLQGYRRYRVPVAFAREPADLLVVLDAAGKVAGVFVLPPVDPAALATAAGEAPAREIPLTVGNAETGLPGLLSLPAGGGPFPAVVLVHGSGANDKDETVGVNKPFRDLAWGLARHGVAVLRYDKRSFARPQDLIALGDRLTARQEVIDDALVALALLRGRPEIDGGRIFVLGHSLGGTLAPRIAVAAEPRPAGVVVLAGATRPLPEMMVAQVRYLFAADGTVSDEEGEQLAALEAAVAKLRTALEDPSSAVAGEGSASTLGAPVGYFRDLEAHDPPAEAAALGIPVLVLQGKRDYQVTMDDFARWQAALAARPAACLRAYDGLDHLFRHGEGPSTPTDYQRPAPLAGTVIDEIAAWIVRGVCPPRR